MYKGFPVGYLLFWETGAEAGDRQIGVDVKHKAPKLLIVDGQQRLTSLYAVMTGAKIVRDDYSEARIGSRSGPLTRPSRLPIRPRQGPGVHPGCIGAVEPRRAAKRRARLPAAPFFDQRAMPQVERSLLIDGHRQLTFRRSR